MAAAPHYDGAGWTTSRAYRVLLEATGVPLVKGSINEYLAAFWFALALVWDTEIVTVDLSEPAAAAATVFAERARGDSQVDSAGERAEAEKKPSAPGNWYGAEDMDFEEDTEQNVVF